jgi:hypothetical protein
MINPLALAVFQRSLGMSGFNFVHFMVGFILVVCAIAIVIILVRWLLSLMGVAIPQPLMVVLGIFLFVVMMLLLLNWSGFNW